MLGNPVLLDVAVTMGLSTAILVGVAVTHLARMRPPRTEVETSSPAPGEGADKPAGSEALSAGRGAILIARLRDLRAWIAHRFRNLDKTAAIRIGTAIAGLLAIALVLLTDLVEYPPSPLEAGIAAALCLAAAGLAATAAHYLAAVDPALLPEGPGLRRGARVVAWILVLAAVSMGLAWAGQSTILRILHFAILTIDGAVCFGLFRVKQPRDEVIKTFPLDLGVVLLLGSRTNILASVLDVAEQQLGIDLRSTWALTVARRTVEPLAIGLCLLGWLSTSLTVVEVEEQGLVERLGVPVAGQPLPPGLHLHWPWPVDRVFRIPVRRVQAITVGHEGEEGSGPEDVLWARQHAANEYTLLLGNGRDLITVDATVQFRITDARAWRYHCQNPADALKAIAYRVVMRSTVNHTLSEALSENVVALTGRMRTMVQQDVDALGLGVEVVTFTVGGMHPPVTVAPDYEDVVSAEISKVTAVVNAQAFHNEIVPSTEALVLRRENAALAEGAGALGRAAGESWSFRTLQSQYRAEPQDYLFRRRLEALEKSLGMRHFTVVDSRFQRDGGELWLIP
jgi:regulator of protease activity HflC (stomatin/prohibitin superfamily)